MFNLGEVNEMELVRSRCAVNPLVISEITKTKKTLIGGRHHSPLPQRFHPLLNYGHGLFPSLYTNSSIRGNQTSALGKNDLESSEKKSDSNHEDSELQKFNRKASSNSPIHFHANKRRLPEQISMLIAKDPKIRGVALNLIRDTLKLLTSIRFGIPWFEEISSLNRKDWDKHIADVTDPTVILPSWFCLPIHGIWGGNDLIQAKEQSLAMRAMASLFGHEIGMKDLRYPHLEAFAPTLPDQPRILDVGCGTGDSMRALEKRYPDGLFTGIDLSPAMLAVGKVRNIDKGFEFIHRAGEDMRFPDETFDLVNESAVAHEVPKHQSIKRFRESFRVLKPGAPFFFLDQDPKSPIIQRQLDNGPLGVYIEPHIRSYCQLDIQSELEKIGFIHVERKKLDPDSTIVVYIGCKPKAKN
jgi:SAM-dependent methyltransferase